MNDRPYFISSEIYRHSRYGAKHPLSISRVAAVTDLVAALGWLPEDRFRKGPVATRDQLLRFHDPDYIDALIRAERQGLSDDEKTRWNIGRNGNPIYGEVFRRPATAAGSSILAADLIGQGGTVYSPAGGTHHGQRDRASGFCYLNDPVLGMLTLLDAGIAPIAYVDLDAHHGDGVEEAFRDDPRVTTISVHQADLWPRSGPAVHDFGPSVMNLPVEAGFNDDEFQYVLETAILPKVSAVAPQALMIQCGVDGLEDDPLSKLSLSNGVYRMAVAQLLPLAPRRIVLGGGGYNPYAVARAWAGVWSVLDDHPVPEELSDTAEAVLRALDWKHSRARTPPDRWFRTLLDPPNHGPVRDSTRETVRAALLASG